jgi:hypothetical protein
MHRPASSTTQSTAGALEEKMFERDWQRATGKEKFWGFMSRENKGNKANKPDKLALQVGGGRPSSTSSAPAAAMIRLCAAPQRAVPCCCSTGSACRTC